MAREIDLSKPLSEEDVAYLQERYSEQHVAYLIGRANAGQFVKSDTPVGGDGLTDAERAQLKKDEEDAAARAALAESKTQQDAEAAAAAKQDSGAEDFDPSKHTVPEVLEFLSRPELTDEQRDAVLAKERAGEARKGILGGD